MRRETAPLRFRDAHHRDVRPTFRTRLEVVEELWELPEAAHVGGLHSRPVEWERRVVAFLDANL